jgi:hypothetical protein
VPRAASGWVAPHHVTRSTMARSRPNLLDLGNAAVRLTLDDVPQVALSLLLLLATGG